MRIREKRYYCGNQMRVHQYPVRRIARGMRGKRYKETTEIQAKLNEKNAFHRLGDLLHTNFTDDDLAIYFTYATQVSHDDDNMLLSIDEAQRDMQNYIRRVKYRFKKYSLPAPKYIYITEQGSTGKIHHHLIISGGIDRDELEKMWLYGRKHSSWLQFDENGLQGLAHYLIKNPPKKAKNKIIRRWNASKNLDQPIIRTNDYRISYKTAKYINDNPYDREYIEKLYPGYTFVRCEPTLPNEYSNGMHAAGLFITLYLCRKDAEFYKKKRKK